MLCNSVKLLFLNEKGPRRAGAPLKISWSNFDDVLQFRDPIKNVIDLFDLLRDSEVAMIYGEASTRVTERVILTDTT